MITTAEPISVPALEDVSVHVVDDNEEAADLVSKYLERAGYAVSKFCNPAEALASVGESPPTVLVTDYHMPDMDGIELADKALELDPDIRIIMMTGAGDEETAQSALRLGAVDYLIKPVDLPVLDQAVRRAVFARAGAEYNRGVQAWLREEVERKEGELRDVTLGALTALVRALESRSPFFEGHSQNVAVYAAELARALELPPSDVDDIRTAGLLHDVGMIAVPDSIIDKPGSLTREEYALLKTHCKRGVEILEPIPGLERAIEYIVQHHERWDGSGYPGGLSGEEISLGGQVVGLAETWIAMSESRAYRDKTDRDQALSEVGSSGEFSPLLLDALRKAEEA